MRLLYIISLLLVVNGLLLAAVSEFVGGTPVAQCTRAVIDRECAKQPDANRNVAERIRCAASNVRRGIYAGGE